MSLKNNNPYDVLFSDPPTKSRSNITFAEQNGLKVNPNDPMNAIYNASSTSLLGTNTGFGESKYDKSLNWFADVNANDVEGSINENRAQQQSGFGQLGLGVLRAGSKAAQEVSKLPGVLGGIGLGIIENTGDLISGKDENAFIDTAFNNQWIKTMNQIGEKINKDLLPVYTKKAVETGDLWDNISSTSFWATDGADGLGFIIGMMAPGAAFEYAALGSKLINAASKSQRLAKYTSMVGKAEEGVTALKTMGITGRNIDSGLAVMGNTLFEAGAEAKGVGDDLDRKKPQFMARRIAEIKNKLAASQKPSEPEYIQAPMEMVQNPDGSQSMVSKGLIPNPNYKSIDQRAAEQAENEYKEQRALAMRNTFISNVGILLGPNAVMHKAIWGKAAQKFEKSAEEGFKGIAKRVGKSGERIGKAFVREGFFEEGSQTTVENMYVNKALNNQLGKPGWEGFKDDFNVGDFAKEYANTLATTEGQKAIFLGGALGGPMMSYQGRKQDVKNRERTNAVLDGIDKSITNFNNIFDNDIYQKNEDGSFKYKTDANGNETTQRLYDNKAVRKVAKDLNFTEAQSTLFDIAARAGNVELVEKLKQEAIFNLILPSIHNGEMGIQALEQQLNENSKFQELTARDASSDNKNTTKEFVKQTLETAKYLQKQNEKFGDFSRDVIDLTHPTATDKQKQDFLNKLNSSYLNVKHKLRQDEKSLKDLEDKKVQLLEELNINPELSVDDILSNGRLLQDYKVKSPLLTKTLEDINSTKEKIDSAKKDIAGIWQGTDKISGAFNDFVEKDNKETEESSDEKVEQANQLINDIANTGSNEELDRLLLPAHVPQKTEAEYNREAELLVVKDVAASINEDQSVDNLKLNLEKLKALNISSVKIDQIAKRIEDRLNEIEEEQNSFKDYLLEAIEAFDAQTQDLNDFMSELNSEIDALLKSKDTLLKSLEEQDKSPKGRNAKLIKELIKEAQDELDKVEKELEYLNGLKQEAQGELVKIEQDLSYIFNRYDQVEKSDFSSVQDIIDYLNDNEDLFKDHRFDFERLLVNKHYTEQNIEGLSTAIDALENYVNVLRDTIQGYLTVEGKIKKGVSPADYKYIREELMKSSKELFESKKELKSEQEKLKRLNKAAIDKQAIKSIKSEEEFWSSLQKFRKEKINPLINNPYVASKLDEKRAELDQQEQDVADAIADEQLDLKEKQLVENPEEVIETVTPTIIVDENGDFQSESLPTQENEDEDNEPVDGENMSEDEVDDALDSEVSGAKVISTNRSTGEALSENLQEFVDYERSPRDKSNDVVTFELGDVSKDVLKAFVKLESGTATPADIQLLKDKLAIKVNISYEVEENGKKVIKTVSSFIEAKTQANQSNPDSKQMFDTQTMPLRESIIDEAVKNKSLKGLSTKIVKQYPGLLTVEYNETGAAKNNIFDLQVFDGMTEDEKVVYFQKNTSFVNWEGNLVSTLNPKKVIQSNFGVSHRGEVFLNIPQNNGQPFYLKLNVSKVSEEKAEAIYEMVNALSQVSQTVAKPTNFQAITVGKFFETLDQLDPQLSQRLQKILKNEIEFVKNNSKGQERNQSLSRFLDLLIYHQSTNSKTGFNLSKDGNLTLGSLAIQLMEGQGFKHELTITKDDMDSPQAKEVIMNYIQYKRHNIIITRDNVGEFVFNSKDYVKYLLNSDYPILTTNAVVNQPTFQGYSNVYLDPTVKNAKNVPPIGKQTVPTPAPVVPKNDVEDKKAEIIGKIDSATKLGTIDELVEGANNDVSGAKGKTYRQLYNEELATLEGKKEEEVLGPEVVIETEEDGTIPAVKARLQAALGNTATPTKKEDVKMDVKGIKDLFNKATEDGKVEIISSLAENLNSLDSIDVENLSKTFDDLISEAQKQNKSIEEINEICGL
jgi:hypothetical protein